MVKYLKLLNYLEKQHEYPINNKKNYVVIVVPGSNYHITIFEDQWDNYQDVSGKPYHLFHISSEGENNRCSSYFWVNKKTLRIKKIPRIYFMYGQPTYNFFSSTRNPCHLNSIMPLVKIFQRLLNNLSRKN